MSEEWKKYVEDPRTVCKYNTSCYQKNPDHHRQFKHPPRTGKRKIPYTHSHDKKIKISPSEDKVSLGDARPSDEKEMTNAFDDNIQSKGGSPNSKKHQKDNGPSKASTSKKEPNRNDKIELVLPKVITYFEGSKENYEKIKELFLSEMPSDFYKLFECFKNDGQDIEKVLSSVNLQLIGPYEMLLGKLPILEDKELYLVHWRFFFDPPEFQAVIKSKGKSEYHMGYFRDSPDEAPVFVASNDSSKGCAIVPVASNIFGAIYMHLQNEKKRSPFTAMACQKLMDKLKHWAESNNFSLEEFNLRKRIVQAATKTLHGAGIIVPFDKKTKVGYRQLVESDATIKKLFAQLASSSTESEKDNILSELQPVITYANIAVDECDFGTGLECGIALFCSGLKELESNVLSCLNSAYGLLNRDAFSRIIQAHMKYRRKGPDMSVLSSQLPL